MASYPDTSKHDHLPLTYKANHYKLVLSNINKEKNTFEGKVSIQFDILDETDSIILNQKFLKITKATGNLNITKTESVVSIKSITNDDVEQTVTFELDQKISKGVFTMDVEFNGIIRNDMCGFYTSSYKDDEGNTNHILTTQFESVDARSAFPCYDEPNAKAQFEVSLIVEENESVLANMPILSSKTLDDGKKGSSDANRLKIVTFETTPLMSTYLLAWCIGKFDYIESFTKTAKYQGKPIPIRVYTKPNNSEQGRFALEMACKSVDYFSEIFKIDYVLPKLDLLAIPEFGANAMENFGMVSFRATALLFDPKTSDLKYQQKVAYVVAHELAHQWFGNLVTMNWWNELWLNEGFATFVGYLAVDKYYPDWNIFTEFVAHDIQTALTLDGLKNTHAIEVPIQHAYEVDEVFDTISYLKGASVIRMLSSSLGNETFLEGVANYVNTHKFGNAKTADLWNGVSEVVGKDVNSLMEPWIKAEGYPYIYVETDEKNEEIKLTQKRFLSTGSNDSSEEATKWWIPLNLEFSDNNGAKIENETISTLPTSFDSESINIPIKLNEIDNCSIFQVNKDFKGFYTTIYEPKLIASISKNLKFLSPEDKINLITGTASGTTLGLIPIKSLLELISELKDEKNYAVWLTIVSTLNKLKGVFSEQPEEFKSGLKSYIQSIYEPIMTELLSELNDKDSENLDFVKTKLISLLYESSGASSLDIIVKDSESKLSKPETIPPFLKEPVYKTILSNTNTCTRESFDLILKDVTNPTSLDSHEVGLSALGCISDSSFFPQLTSLFFSKSMAEMDAKFLVESLSRNSTCKKMFWEFIRNSFGKFRKDYSNWTFDRLLRIFLPGLQSEEYLAEVTKFFEENDTSGFDKGVKQSIDSISSSVSYINKNQSGFESWLKENRFM
ncbi:peptidase activity, acting on L-amino acid peptides protein [[Candida] boidinii]|nr:peptidase activity, acting on L-amino acid peptides protein [[Candida] boidinii]OWB60533.1 peptidase activity, acting on L-amino acid peptides protein [[Candida] boidinii]